MQMVNSIIAKVNGEEIHESDLDGAVARYIVQLEEEDESNFEPNPDNLKYLKTEALNHLIDRTILYQSAVKEGVEVTHEAVRENLDSMRANFETTEEWKNNLLALHIQEENLFDALKKDMIIEKYLGNHYVQKVEFTQEDLKKYYQENERMMKEPDLFSFYEIYANNAAQVKVIYEMLQTSIDFDVLESDLEKLKIDIQNHSDIPGFNIPEQVFTVLDDLEIGKIGTMPAPDGGMLVYKLLRKSIGKPLQFEQIKEKLAEYLIAAAKNDVTDQLVESARSSADIEFVDTSYIKKL